MSALASELIQVRWCAALSRMQRSIRRQRNVLPPRTTRQAQLSLPKNLCNSFFDALFLVDQRVTNSLNSDNLSAGKDSVREWVSIWTPRKVKFFVGGTSLSQLISRPSETSRLIEQSRSNQH